jgi:two-component system, NtrC family, sensor histidine kinase HydH
MNGESLSNATGLGDQPGMQTTPVGEDAVVRELRALVSGGSASPLEIELARVLVVATEGQTRGRVHQRLEEDFDLTVVNDFAAAVRALGEQRYALALLDLREATQPAAELAEELRRREPEMSVIVLTAGRSVKVVGAQCLHVPFDAPDIVAIVREEAKVAQRRRARTGAIGELQDVILALQGELQAKGALAAHGEASASMVHDIRNALFSTLGYTARLVQESARLKSALGERAQPIDQIARKLEHTSNYLFHLAQTCRFNDGEQAAAARRERVELRAELMHVRSVLFFESPKLVVEGLPHAWICGDRFELHRVAQNLTKNAFEAGATLVRMTLEEVPLMPGTLFAQYQWTITDNGPGFPPEEAVRALELPLKSSKREGQGLGLRICRQIVRQHGGEIVLQAAPGGGAQFVITLPQA